MFYFLCLKCSNVIQEKHSLRLKIESLTNRLSDTKETLAQSNIKVTNLSLTKIDIHSKKDYI